LNTIIASVFSGQIAIDGGLADGLDQRDKAYPIGLHRADAHELRTPIVDLNGIFAGVNFSNYYFEGELPTAVTYPGAQKS
jgi:hypothetical protein